MRKAIVLFFLLLGLSVPAAFGGEDLRMDKESLLSMLDSPDLVLLDVRAGRDWSSSEFKIKGAIRTPGSEFESWSEAYPKDKNIVLYCA